MSLVDPSTRVVLRSTVYSPPSSQYRTDDEITFGSPDREDTFSTWDCQAQHSDDTIMGTTLEGTAVYDEAVYEPPPKLEDIEAIARQPSPGRYGHGIPLEFGEYFVQRIEGSADSLQSTRYLRRT
jgi:hypothetical protein